MNATLLKKKSPAIAAAKSAISHATALTLALGVAVGWVAAAVQDQAGTPVAAVKNVTNVARWDILLVIATKAVAAVTEVVGTDRVKAGTEVVTEAEVPDRDRPATHAADTVTCRVIVPKVKNATTVCESLLSVVSTN